MVCEMFWFGRPAYLRWLAAAALIVGAAAVEFWPTAQAVYPFTAAPVEVGEAPRVEWRVLPAGIYERADITGAVASHPMGRGEPITPSDLRLPIGVPEGWWALAVEVPIAMAPGAEVRLVLGEGHTVPGLVVAFDDSDRFDVSGPTALIAVPAGDAPAVATAAAERRLVVLVAP